MSKQANELGPYEIYSNDLKKGDRVRLRNGWYAARDAQEKSLRDLLEDR